MKNISIVLQFHLNEWLLIPKYRKTQHAFKEGIVIEKVATFLFLTLIITYNKKI